jgi:hypothetical protein
MRMLERITDDDLAAFLRGCAAYFRGRSTGGEDAAYWVNESCAERCEIAAERLLRALEK